MHLIRGYMYFEPKPSHLKHVILSFSRENHIDSWIFLNSLAPNYMCIIYITGSEEIFKNVLQKQLIRIANKGFEH